MSSDLSRRSFVALTAAVLARLRGWAQPRARVDWAWMGACTSEGITIKAHAAPGVTVALSTTLADAAGGETALRQTAPTDPFGVATFVLRGLQPHTRYRYTVDVEGTPPLAGAFRTLANGPMSFRAVFASCASTGSRSAVFTQMRAHQPDLFFHMGDLHYRNIHHNSPAEFARAYQEVLTSPTQAELFRYVPVAYIWDDHDYGPDNSDRTSPSRPAALSAYRSFVPHYPLDPAPDATIHQAFTFGRVRVLITDTRSARTSAIGPPEQRTMLGPDQLAWLLRELESAAAAAAPLVIWVNTVPWITKRDETTDEGWAPYARERRTIAGAIRRLGLSDRLLMLSGDGHMLALDDGTNSEYAEDAPKGARGFVVAHAAPLDRWPRIKGGLYSYGAVKANGQFGVLDVTDDGSRLEVVIQGWRGAHPVRGMRHSFACPGGPCAATDS